MATSTVDRFTAAIETGGGLTPDLFTDDAIVDATVPNWRFTMRGQRAAAEGERPRLARPKAMWRDALDLEVAEEPYAELGAHR